MDLDDTSIMTEAKYFASAAKSSKKILFSLYYIVAKTFWHANDIKTRHFKKKDAEVKPYSFFE